MLNLIIDSDYLTGMQRQIANQIAVLIRNGVIEPEEILPSEAKLAEHHNVSRNVVREAYRILKDKKLIKTDRSRGTVVVDDPNKSTFSENLRVHLPASLKEKIDVAALYQKINPNEFVERELTEKVEQIIGDLFLKHQIIERVKLPTASEAKSVESGINSDKIKTGTNNRK